MHISIGMDRTKLTRENMRGRDAGLGLLLVGGGHDAETFFWFGQMITQTLSSMMMPSQPPTPMCLVALPEHQALHHPAAAVG